MHMRDMDINVHERLSSKTTQIKVKALTFHILIFSSETA